MPLGLSQSPSEGIIMWLGDSEGNPRCSTLFSTFFEPVKVTPQKKTCLGRRGKEAQLSGKTGGRIEESLRHLENFMFFAMLCSSLFPHKTPTADLPSKKLH